MAASDGRSLARPLAPVQANAGEPLAGQSWLKEAFKDYHDERPRSNNFDLWTGEIGHSLNFAPPQSKRSTCVSNSSYLHQATRYTIGDGNLDKTSSLALRGPRNATVRGLVCYLAQSAKPTSPLDFTAYDCPGTRRVAKPEASRACIGVCRDGRTTG